MSKPLKSNFCRWTFWYVHTVSHREKKRMSKKNNRYHEYTLHEVFTFGTIEDFWKMYNNTYSISEVISNTDYLIFKKGIRPEWEDPANIEGGKWVVTLPIEDDMEEEVDKAWLQLLLHVIGGIFEKKERDMINGMIFTIRDKHLRISLWCN
jgi:translation initiation factor 4E